MMPRHTPFFFGLESQARNKYGYQIVKRQRQQLFRIVAGSAGHEIL